MWFFGAGSLGGFQYLIILFSSAMAILLSGLRRHVFMCCLIIIIVAIIATEYKYPFLVIGYSNNTDRFIDISFGLIITIISNALMFVVVLNNYNKEHNKAKEYLTKIEKQHLEIEFQENLKIINKQLKQEIAEREQIEKLLRESEKKYRNLVENINDAIFTINKQGLITYISIAIEKILLYKVDDIIGKPFVSFIHPEDQNGLLTRLSVLCLKGCNLTNFVYLIRTVKFTTFALPAIPYLKEVKLLVSPVF
jgi:PAS domain-containing protein